MKDSIVIFDLDGTITIPVLDFDLIRDEMGLPQGRPILESLEEVSDEKRAEAMEVLFRHEKVAAEGAELQDGAYETIQSLRERGYRVAILTRNARRWTQVVLDKYSIEVDAIHTREDGVVKPSPEPVQRLCAQFSIDPTEAWMIGDHLFDVLSGKRAGGNSILFASEKTPDHFAHEADHVVTSLVDIIPIITQSNHGEPKR